MNRVAIRRRAANGGGLMVRVLNRVYFAGRDADIPQAQRARQIRQPDPVCRPGSQKHTTPLR